MPSLGRPHTSLPVPLAARLRSLLIDTICKLSQQPSRRAGWTAGGHKPTQECHRMLGSRANDTRLPPREQQVKKPKLESQVGPPGRASGRASELSETRNSLASQHGRLFLLTFPRARSLVSHDATKTAAGGHSTWVPSLNCAALLMQHLICSPSTRLLGMKRLSIVTRTFVLLAPGFFVVRKIANQLEQSLG